MAAPAARFSTVTMTREAITVGFDATGGFLGRTRGHDIARFRCAGRRFVSISHPGYVDHVLHRARLKYVKSDDYEPIRAAAGINLLTDEGDSWAAHRTTLNPTFARRHLNEMVDLIIDPIDRVTGSIDTAAAFDMHEMMVVATLRVVANALFSQDFGPLVASMNDLATRGLRRTEKFGRLGLLGLMPSADLLNVSFQADNGTWSRKRIRDEALTFMLAGHETTANAMSWFWYLVAVNPDARDRMLAEIDDVLGGRRPTADDLSRLPWTTACIQESQRYFLAVWMIARDAIEDDIIDGHHIRPGTTVLIPIHHIHHDERWWPDPEAFDPTRFLGDAGKDRPRSAYLPFGGGRRICIGQSFALMEMVLMAAIISQRFTFDVHPGHPVELEATLTLRPKRGLHVIAQRREAL